MNELSDYRRAIGSFLPSRGPRRRRKWQPSCRQKLSTKELLKISLAGILWVTAVYISIDVNLQQLAKNPPPVPVPVSGLFSSFHTLPCYIEKQLCSLALWGKGGLPGLFDTYMGFENWHNRVTWALVSYGTHELFLALKLRTAGDIELNPGPNPTPAELKQDKTPCRRNTRSYAREVPKTPLPSMAVQAGELQGMDSKSTPKTSGTSVSSLHLTPVPARQDRYRTPISKELEDATKAQNQGQDHLSGSGNSGLASPYTSKGEAVTNSSLTRGDQELDQEDSPSSSQLSKALQSSQDLYEIYSGAEESGGKTTHGREEEKSEQEEDSVQTDPDPDPEGLEDTIEAEDQVGVEYTAATDNESPVTLRPNSSSQSSNVERAEYEPTQQQNQPTDEGEHPIQTDIESSTNTVHAVPAASMHATTTPPTTMDDADRQRSRPAGSIHKAKQSISGQSTSSTFSHFPGHTCEYDSKGKTRTDLLTNQEAGHAEEYKARSNNNNNNLNSDTHSVYVTGATFGSGGEEVLSAGRHDTSYRTHSSRNSHRNSPMMDDNRAYSHDNMLGSQSDRSPDNTMNESRRHKPGRKGNESRRECVSERVRDKGQLRGQADRGHTGSSQGYTHSHSYSHGSQQASSHSYSHSHKRVYSHPHPHPHSNPHPHSHSHSHSHPYTHTQSYYPQMSQNQAQAHNQAQFQVQQVHQTQAHQQCPQVYQPYSSSGDYTTARDKVSHYGNTDPQEFPNTGASSQGDAMNEYYQDWRERENPLEAQMSSAMDMIMAKMESQQEKLQRQLQLNQAHTNRGIEDTQMKISFMHKDIQNIQQEVRETNLEVQQNKEEIKLLQEKQDQLQTQQESALAKTQRELKIAQDEISTMKQSLEDMDNAIESRDEELEEMQEELMEARKNLNRVESHNRRGNLKIFGIAEHQGEDKEQCEEVAIQLLNKYMPGHDWEVEQIEKAHRLGKPREGGRARPILVKMANPQDTYYILGNRDSREKMKKDNIHLSQDLTRDQQDVLKLERDKGNLAYFVGGKLVIRKGEGKFYNRDRDSSRGRRRDRSSSRDRGRGSSSSSLSKKRDRKGSTISGEHSRAGSDSRTRHTQGSGQDSPHLPTKPWRFGTSQRGSSTSRDRRGLRYGDKADEEEDENTFKKPAEPAYRARPAHRNPYYYQSRSASRQTRNSSPPGSRKMSTHRSKQDSSKNSRVNSPSSSPANSPSASRIGSTQGSAQGSAQGSRNTSKHSSRGASPQHIPNKLSENEEKDQQQKQKELEELRERLRQLSEETPSKHKPATHTYTNTKWSSTQAAKPKEALMSQTGSTQTPEKDRKQEGSDKNSDSDISPGTKQPTKRQKTTYRRYGSKNNEKRTAGPSQSSSLDKPAQAEEGQRASRPRTRVYSGRRFRSQTLRRQKALLERKQSNQDNTSTMPNNKDKNSTPTLTTNKVLTQNKRTPKKDEEKGLQTMPDKSNGNIPQAGTDTTALTDSQDTCSNSTLEMEVSPLATKEPDKVISHSHSPMETGAASPTSPETPQEPKHQQSGEKKKNKVAGGNRKELSK